MNQQKLFDMIVVEMQTNKTPENNFKCGTCGDTGILEFCDYDEDGNLITGEMPCFCTRELKGE